ncbi:hypothetical protein DRO38_07530 [Candidatus Bathyarchaeota archaeon]|nr:MAG: hypothetical protein DRO38_07530 [Candidatus Bathyarchaeota archaeon]
MGNIKARATFVLLLIVGIGMVGTAAADPGIVMEVTPIDNEVLPGEIATYEVNVSYFMTPPSTEHVVLSIDNPIWNYTFDPAEFDINSGESKYSTLNISVPTDASPGTYTHTVNATATGVLIPPVIITERVTTTVETTVIPEFSTIAIPVVAILVLVFLFNRRKH